MKWEDVRKEFPDQWVLIEVERAFTNENSERILEDVRTLKGFTSSSEAMKSYKQLHLQDPTREMYVLHTSRKEPNIIEKKWVGVRRL